jgi:CRP/FNR family transcriptional regulator, nitrogen oxide reductase regulator
VARQGEPAQALYVVEDGLLKLTQLSTTGREVIVRFAGTAEPFGGIVAVEGSAYPVSARAVEPSSLRTWTGQTLGPLLDRFPRVRMNIMREMTAHMNDALDRVSELSNERVGPRLAHCLVRLMQSCGEQTSEGILITHPLTRQELAQFAGTSLFTASRTLSQWETEGVLRSAHRRLLVCSPERLHRLTMGIDE